MHEKDVDWLPVLWRELPLEEQRSFHLRTIVYGTACAPYQVICVIQHLASDDRQHFPKGALGLETNMYVDDPLAGADAIEEAQLIQMEVIGILASADMYLDKWSSRLYCRRTRNPFYPLARLSKTKTKRSVH